MTRFIVEADGGSRGYPGVAAGGAVVINADTGEYSGLVGGLRKARELDPVAPIHVRMDSKLVVEQMSGRWKIKHPDMRELAREAHAVIAGADVTFEWIAREFNSRADSVANESMDRRDSFG